LTALDIVQCFDLSVETVNFALRQCTKLTRFGFNLNAQARSLDFSLLANVTDLHFVVDNEDESFSFTPLIAENCPKLQHLLLDAIEEPIQPDDLDCIIDKCVHIRTLKYEFYNYFSSLPKVKINAWKQMRPLLEITRAYD